jgi:hypothetical protein
LPYCAAVFSNPAVNSSKLAGILTNTNTRLGAHS